MGLHTVPVVFDTNNGSMSVLGLGPIDGNLVRLLSSLDVVGFCLLFMLVVGFAW